MLNKLFETCYIISTIRFKNKASKDALLNIKRGIGNKIYYRNYTQHISITYFITYANL